MAVAPGVERLVLAGPRSEVDEIDAQERVVITTEPVATAATDGTLVTASGRGEVEIAVIAVDAWRRGHRRQAVVTWTTHRPATANANDVLEPETPITLASGERPFSRPRRATMVGPAPCRSASSGAFPLPPPVTSTMVNLPVQRASACPIRASSIA
ncbi:MAG: hypothetical protein IPI49_23330 [Myxococcales bacterium]|nr:hypothetical protein [Myxococcales bacterium]